MSLSERCTRRKHPALNIASRAIDLDPNMVAARLWFGWTIIFLVKLDAAIGGFQAVLRLSPLEPRLFLAHQGIAFAEFLAGRYDRSLAQSTISLRLRPDFPVRTDALPY
jgi:hypothetical protein